MRAFFVASVLASLFVVVVGLLVLLNLVEPVMVGLFWLVWLLCLVWAFCVEFL